MLKDILRRSGALLTGAVLLTPAGCGVTESSTSSEEEPTTVVQEQERPLTHEDDHSVLFILSGSGDVPGTFVLMRSVPVDGELVFAGIPANSADESGGRTRVLSESFEQGGGPSAESFVENVLDIDIDWYMTLEPETFVQLCDMASGGGSPSGREILAQVTDTSSGTEQERADKAAEIIINMVESAGGDYLADNIDGAFPIISRGSDNDISQSDFDGKSYAIKSVLRSGNTGESYRFEGVSTDSDFLFSIDDESAAEFREKYYK